MATKSPLERFLRSPYTFAILTIALLTFYVWPYRWLISGAPILTLLLLSRESPTLHLYPLFTTLHLTYSICSTSPLLYNLFTALCYPLIFFLSLTQFPILSRTTRSLLRRVLREVHWIDDKIAYFNIPALEIDTEVQGLMVLRGITFVLSEASFWVHGVEVGIKLDEGVELAIAVETVKVGLFRGVEVGDVFANLKGGKGEMTFAGLEDEVVDGGENGGDMNGGGEVGGEEVFVEGTALLKAASRDGDQRSIGEVRERPVKIKQERIDEKEEYDEMTETMTDGKSPDAAGVKEGLESMEKMPLDHDEFSGRYHQTINFISSTNTIHEARSKITRLARRKSSDTANFQEDDENAVRAAICSQLHSQPSVPHPPQKAIKVTTLQNLMPPSIRAFTHRLPMLLRLLLNPLSYFHPVKISSITATASGHWLNTLLLEKIFLSYATSSSELRSLRTQLASYLTNASFAIELKDITGIAQVPFLPSYDINCHLTSTDIIAYRALPESTRLEQVVRLGGADAAFVVPSFLLPHHEHLIPPPPSKDDKQELKEGVESADGVPEEVHAKYELDQAIKDETNVKISVHARLPAVFAQELLDFIAALVKATKVVEMEREESVMDEEVSGVRDFGRKIRGGFKEGVKKVVVDRVVRERWIAWVVGKVVGKLEEAKGDVGYSGDIPVALGIYRKTGWETEGEKLLP